MRQGDLSCKANNTFSLAVSLHQSGNKLLLCVLAVFYTRRERDAQSMSPAELKKRDIGLTGFIKHLCGVPAASANKFVGQGLTRAVQQKLEEQVDGKLVTKKTNKIDIEVEDVMADGKCTTTLIRRLAHPDWKSRSSQGAP